MMQVLVADDSAVTLKMIAGGLKRSGYEVMTAKDGRQALKALRNSTCQLVVSDWQMPHMTGIELCKAVRSEDLGRYIYVILLTSNDQPQDVLEGLEAGADDFVTKPFNPPEIAMRLATGVRLLTLESTEMTIFAMARLAESRDPETGAHLERVRSYCRILAEQLREHPKHREVVDREYIRLIYLTSPLHDIGKVAIPDCVLLKAGRLSNDEFEIMKNHALCGAATLEAAIDKFPNAGFLRMAHDITLTHHEKYDGTGYPNALKGDDIPLCGRIVALADVYDAVTSKRVYKEAFTHAVTRSVIVEGRSAHFDPDIVDAFLTAEQSFLDVREQFAKQDALAA
jgi:putative two-component system response regulator